MWLWPQSWLQLLLTIKFLHNDNDRDDELNHDRDYDRNHKATETVVIKRNIKILLSNIYGNHDRDLMTATAITTVNNNMTAIVSLADTASATVTVIMIVTVIVKVISTITINLIRDDMKSTSKCSCSLA